LVASILAEAIAALGITLINEAELLFLLRLVCGLKSFWIFLAYFIDATMLVERLLVV
jgi:hypothetical protein